MKNRFPKYHLIMVFLFSIIFLNCKTPDSIENIEFTRVSFVRSWTNSVFTSYSLDFVFGRDIDNFSVNDITIIDNSGIGITKGNLTRTDPGRYRLIVTNITKDGEIIVIVEKDNFVFIPDRRSAYAISSTVY
jgi:hypothetical protein